MGDAVPIKSLTMKDVELLIGAADAADVSETDPDYRHTVDTVTLNPTSQPVSWTGLGGETQTDVTSSQWTMTLAGAQDWDTEDSLCGLLFDHEGETRPYRLRPRRGGPGFKGQMILTPGAIGGTVNTKAPYTATLGLIGKPVRVPAPVAP